MNLEQGKKMLCAQGLNMFSVLSCNKLPQTFHAAVRQAGLDLLNYPSLILIGHAGNAMWRQLRIQGRLAQSDPVDAFSLFHATRFVNEYLDACPHMVLYPGEIPIPLQKLGVVAGWQHRSPLGVGINESFGPWFGYRAALLVQAALPEDVLTAGESPCDRCSQQPCVSTCPAGALSAADSPDVQACVNYRLQQNSPCASQCLARLACPVGRQHRYGDEQLHYFYRRSLGSIKKYLAG